VPDNNDEKSWSSRYVVAAGSVAGREHTRVRRNNQDGLAVRVEPERIIAAVCDGCSAGRSSEVGARLGAAWIVAHLPRILAEDPDERALPERLATDLVAYLRQIAAGLGGGPEVVHHHLLFTILIALVEPERTLILGLGDGLYSVDGAEQQIDPGPDNAPPYLAYRLVDPERLEGASLEPLRVHVTVPRAESIWIATDGVAAVGLGELATNPRNPSLLQKRLNVLERAFSDDATAISIRKLS
jgi:hypothetical protein